MVNDLPVLFRGHHRVRRIPTIDHVAPVIISQAVLHADVVGLLAHDLSPVLRAGLPGRHG
jgi:hypothetical protein